MIMLLVLFIFTLPTYSYILEQDAFCTFKNKEMNYLLKIPKAKLGEKVDLYQIKKKKERQLCSFYITDISEPSRSKSKNIIIGYKLDSCRNKKIRPYLVNEGFTKIKPSLKGVSFVFKTNDPIKCSDIKISHMLKKQFKLKNRN